MPLCSGVCIFSPGLHLQMAYAAPGTNITRLGSVVKLRDRGSEPTCNFWREARHLNAAGIRGFNVCQREVASCQRLPEHGVV